jgi:hypothetical protein
MVKPQRFNIHQLKKNKKYLGLSLNMVCPVWNQCWR